MKRAASTSSSATTGPTVRSAKKAGTRGSRLMIAAGGSTATSPSVNSADPNILPQSNQQQGADVSSHRKSSRTHKRPEKYGDEAPTVPSPTRRPQRVHSKKASPQSATTPLPRQGRRASPRKSDAAPARTVPTSTGAGHTKKLPPPSGANRSDSGVVIVGGDEAEVWATLMGLQEGQEEEEQIVRREDRINVRMNNGLATYAERQEGAKKGASCPLEAMFFAMEQVLPLFHRRRQAALWKDVRIAVEGMCRRSFTRQHLAQIVYVQPDAYKLSSKTDARPTRGGYRLRDILLEMGPAGSDDTNKTTPRERNRAAGRLGVSSRRRQLFHEGLASARTRHCQCGAVTDRFTGARAECSCLPGGPLPDTSPLPLDCKVRRGRGGGDPADGLLWPIGTECDDIEDWEVSKDMGSLREQLRQKDLLSALERRKTGEQKEADRRRKGNLPVLADAVRSFFAHSRKSRCSMDVLVDAISGSTRHALSAKEAQERIRMLADVVPEWCSIIAPPAAGAVGAAIGGTMGRSTITKEVVRVNTRIHYGEVRQMIAFMAGGGGAGGEGSL